jgi:small subunit ribosomal protein S4
MGTVRKPRKKYSGPGHPWEGERIEEEKKLSNEYGLKNKKEIWKISSKLSGVKSQAKKLIADTSDQGKKEEKFLLEKMVALGLLTEGATLDDILEIDVRKFLNRRLQSVVLTKGLARTSKQARQMISHGHIAVSGRKTNIPSYMVKLKEENEIKYSINSNFKDAEHPELNIKKKEELKKVDLKETLKKPEPKIKETITKVQETPEVKQEVPGVTQ